MKLIEIGRVYLKIAGKEAGLKAVIVDKVDNSFVLIDGEVKRRRCNVRHLIPLEFKLDIKAKAKTEDVREALKKMGLWKTELPKKKIKKKERKEKRDERPRKKHVVKTPPEEKPKKKPVKKKAPVKKPAKTVAKKAPVKKPVKTVAKKAPVKKPAKTVAKKAPVKKPVKKK